MPITIARRRAALAKRTLAFGSVLVFAVTVGLARANHPARAAASTSSPPATDSSQTSSAGSSRTSSAGGGFGQADVTPAPDSVAPSVSTEAS